jgi:hypothetical protein
MIYIKKLAISTIFLFIICISLVNAVMFDYNTKSVLDTIYPNQTALYTIKISNNNDYADRIQLYTISAYWDISPTLLPIQPVATITFPLEITLLDERLYGPQLVPVTIKSLADGTSVIENFYVYIRATNQTAPSYSPSAVLDVAFNKTFDPSDPNHMLSLNVHLRNKNPLNLKDIKFIVSSELFKEKEVSTSLGPLEEKTLGVLLAIDPLQAPGTYNISVRLVANNISITESRSEIQVLSYSDIAIEQTKTSGLFSSTETIKLTNHGNYQATKIEKIPKNFFEKIFTTTSAKYQSITENGISYIAWTIPLSPEQPVEITITTNYIVLVIIIILIIIGIISYYVFRSPVLLLKNAKIVSSSEDGVSEVKVRLHIKNRSSRTIKNIKIVDKYPKIIQIEDELSLGMLKPTKMLSADKSNSLLMWNLEVLDPYEERLLTYKLKSQLNIVGNVSLPSAKIKFSTGVGERTYYSNNVKLLHKSQDVFREV